MDEDLRVIGVFASATLNGAPIHTLGPRKNPSVFVKDPEARYFGGRLEERSLVPWREARLGRINLEEWLWRSRDREWNRRGGDQSAIRI